MYENFPDKNLLDSENIAKLVLEAKLKNLPFAILRNAVEKAPTEQDFNKYIDHINNKNSSRIQIKEEDLRFFPGWYEIQRTLIRVYGNPVDPYNSLLKTNIDQKNKIHASLHPDQSDVIHLLCYGSVEWLLVDPWDNNKEYKITLHGGDVLYMRGFVLHETIPLSNRGSLIFMNLSLKDFPDYLTEENRSKTDEEREEFFKKQRKEMLERLENKS